MPSPNLTTAAPVDLRPFMAEFPTGVSVVTSFETDGGPWGMTCSSLCSVALEPPTLIVCLREGSPTLRAVLAHGSFALNLLHEQSRETAELFASGARDRFDRVVWTAPDDGRGGPRLTESAHLTADCAVARVEYVGDHAVVFGEVLRVTRLSSTAPLLYGMRNYASWPVGAKER